jgi:NhaC family Na+:H+ antiporter
MILYGLQTISPSLFLMTAFLACAVVSIVSGSSWSVIATFGVAFSEIANGLGIPIVMTAGAIASGAFIGDKWSPMSDSTQMAAAVGGQDVFKLFRYMIPTNGVALVLMCILFLLLGFKYAGQTVDVSGIETLSANINEAFTINLLLLLPVVLIIVLSMMRYPVLPVLIISVALACALAIFIQGHSFSNVMNMLWKGFVSKTGNAQFDNLMKEG